MQRFIRLAATRPQLSPLPRVAHAPPHLPPVAPASAAFASTTSAPKEAEEASAQSGGSRSKDFKEANQSEDHQAAADDTPSGSDARGRTGGGKPLKSSDHPPPQPKIWNAAVPPEKSNMTDEQKAEVEQHNKEFEEKHNRSQPAGQDKVDKKFWSSDANKSVKN